MSKVPTEKQVSAGGVAFRRQGNLIEVALISVGEKGRWQLPKGLVDPDESTEAAALREVREEAGIDTEVVGALDKIEYWYYSSEECRKVRYHKYVHFYLLRYLSGDVAEHDQEVNEARWVDIDQAAQMLSFTSEKKVVQLARGQITALP